MVFEHELEVSRALATQRDLTFSFAHASDTPYMSCRHIVETNHRVTRNPNSYTLGLPDYLLLRASAVLNFGGLKPEFSEEGLTKRNDFGIVAPSADLIAVTLAGERLELLVGNISRLGACDELHHLFVYRDSSPSAKFKIVSSHLPDFKGKSYNEAFGITLDVLQGKYQL